MIELLSSQASLRALLLLFVCFEDPQIFVPNGIYATEQPKEVAKVETPTVAAAPVVKLQVWTASWCRYCPNAIAEAQAAASVLGIPVELVDYDKWAAERAKANVEAPPTVSIVINDKSYEQLKGGAKKDDLIVRVRVWQSQYSKLPAAEVAPPAPREVSLLSTSPPHVSIFRPEVNTIKYNYSNPVSDSGRYVQYGGREYDMTTWSRMCSMKRCDMCNYLDRMQANYFASRQVSVPSPQAPSPDEVVTESLALMKLTPNDVVAELGSGDGTPAIRMARETGCRVVGVEIDPKKVAESRKKVQAAGLSDRITIIEEDVLKFDPKKYGITAVYAYLDPLLLLQIPDTLTAGRVAVCPGHKPEGLDAKLVGQCWVVYN